MLGVEPGRETITIDYFVRLFQGGAEPIVVDTGFTPQIAEARKRKYLASPADQLRKLGVDPADVKTVLISHLHWDHFGGFGFFRADGDAKPVLHKLRSLLRAPRRLSR
jgi:glyoxylase-like metal-dependent hydrolase (beta-lactamase superfamily II)